MKRRLRENKSIDTDIEGIDAKRISVISKRDVAKTKLMEGLKILEDERKEMRKLEQKYLVEEKDKSIKNKIDDLNLEG